MFIVFEGIDGSGKTSQLQTLAKALRDMGHTVVESCEPTNAPKGRKARESAKSGRYSIAEEYALFVEDRREHVNSLITPALERGDIVLLDRYYFSTMAYQGSRGMDVRAIREENEAFAPQPDLLFIFDLPVQSAMERIHKRDGRYNAFEQKEGLEFCRQVFLGITGEWVCRIDATETQEETHRKVLARVMQHLGKQGKKNDLQ